MSKITITIEADSLEEVYSIMKLRENEIVSQEGKHKKELSEFKLAHRENKKWTDFELDFLKENYLSKNIKWIAGRLGRKKESCYSMLNKMYKLGLKKKKLRVINVK